MTEGRRKIVENRIAIKVIFVGEVFGKLVDNLTADNLESWQY
jgi:hypothetical protein